MKPTVTISLKEYNELLEMRKIYNGSNCLVIKYYNYDRFWCDFSHEEIYISKDSVNDEILKNNITLADQISLLIEERNKIKAMSYFQFRKFKKQ